MLGPAVLGGLLLVLLRHRRRARATFLSVVDVNAQSVAVKPAFLPPTRTVAVFTSAFDPISSSELRVRTAESRFFLKLCRDLVDCRWLLSYVTSKLWTR